ncbi:hypothetical protein IW148_000691 [Coemansia sp. RSA 1199]|nr:hypothetical protein IW148_000691 [Coemansia sp. RSA 1199]
MALLTNPEDIARITPATRALSKAECTDLYNTNAALIELREYVQRYSYAAPSKQNVQSKPRNQNGVLSLPIVSLCDVVNSLLEETRYQEGIRFLINVNSPLLLQDARVLGNLLAIFKPTHLIEDDLKQRSTYLLGHAKTKSIDYSELWKIGDERRQSIIRAQQSVVSYLVAAKTQFMRPWFVETYKSEPSRFWTYLQELTTLPQTSSSQTTTHLELEMYAHRVTVAGVLLEQMNADLAAHITDIHASVFLKVVSEGLARSSRISYPAVLLDTLQTRFEAIATDRCLHEETQLVTHLLDLIATASTCDALSRDNCVQAIAKFLINKPCADRRRFLDCIRSDVLALHVIDYMLVTWHKFSTGQRGPRTKSTLSSPPGIAKTAFCLQYARLPSNKTNPHQWHNMVTLLITLTQRTLRAFSSRLCSVNVPTDDLDSPFMPVMLVTNHSANASTLHSACQELRSHIDSTLQSSQCTSDESCGSVYSDGHFRAGTLKMLYAELDLLEAYLATQSKSMLDQKC